MMQRRVTPAGTADVPTDAEGRLDTDVKDLHSKSRACLAPVNEFATSGPRPDRKSLEIELKLTGRAPVLASALEDLGGPAARTSKVLSTYYDTPDGRLWRRGFTLRLRPKGKVYELTLKREGGDRLKRGEWTARIPEPKADPALLPDDVPREEIGLVLAEELAPMFSSEIKRTKKVIEAESMAIEASLDLGDIVAGAARMPVAELELELVRGAPEALLGQARTLLGRRRLALEARSKASRGVELAQGLPPAYDKASRPELILDDTVDTAVAKIVAVTARQVVNNLAAAADGRDPEGVHQLRVALRRFRSALSLFKGRLGRRVERMNDEARRALKSLGPARDLDVFLTETLPPVMESHPGTAALERLAEIAEERRAAAYKDVRRLVVDRRFNRFAIDLMTLAETGGLVARDGDTPLGPLATSLLRKRRKQVLKKGGDFAHLTQAERHRVRIALKKLRYACDYFQTLYPADHAKRYLKRLSDLQDDLGRLNDATVAAGLVDELAASDAEAVIGAALVKGWYSHRLSAVEPHMLEAWSRFADAKPFWRG